MPYFQRPNYQVEPRDPYLGPTPSPFDVFGQMFEQQTKVDSQLGAPKLFMEEYVQGARQFAEETGIPLPEALESPDTEVFSQLLRDRATGRKRARFVDTGFPFRDATLPKRSQGAKLDEVEGFDRKMREAQKRGVSVKTLDQALSRAGERAKQIEQETGDILSRADLLGHGFGFAGAVLGSFDPRTDPLNAFTLPLGGFGRTAGTRILTEAGVVAGVETGIQFGAVVPNREVLGLDRGNPLFNILAAGVGAGAFRGILEGSGPAYRAIEARIDPARAKARIFRDELAQAGDVDNVILSRLSAEERDRVLLEALRSRPAQTAQTRAAAMSMEQLIEAYDGNPFGDTRAGRKLHEAMFNAAVEALQPGIRGGPQRLMASTAIIRTMVRPGPDRDAMFRVLADGWVDAETIAQTARMRSPDIFQKLDEARADLARLEQEARKPRRTDIELVKRQADQEFQEITRRLARIEKRIESFPTGSKDKTKAGKERLEAEREALTRRANEFTGGGDGPLRSDLVVPDDLASGIEKARTRVARLERRAETEVANAVRAIGKSGPAPIRTGRYPDPRQSVSDTILEARRAADTRLERSEAEFERALEVANDPEAAIEIGEAEIPRDMKFILLDRDGNLVERTIDDILDEQAQDDALAEAVRVCAL